jgi:hypothetical protein
VRTIRFHRELYPGNVLDEALKLYQPFAAIRRSEEARHWVVTLTAEKEARESRIAGELANYALGLTVQKRSRKLPGKD